ncbi:TIM-barrel domain-containing protein [Reichenbachiella sp. MALMAid0571]|uniref:TIM-barrel domain-containing protein n=1 Tax=Reichenbachiella sp. MALMAid0571 TaxID=3143939 RepID=UPI0032DE97BC
MKNRLLSVTILMLTFLLENRINAQDFSWKYTDNDLMVELKYPTQTLYASFSFSTEDQLLITGTIKGFASKNTNRLPVKSLFKENTDGVVLSTGKAKVNIDKSTQLISIVRLPNDLLWKGKLGIAPHPETKKPTIQITAVDCSDEHYFGLGERLNGFDQKGKQIIMELDDAWSRSNEMAYKAIPFYMSSRNYGVLVNSPERIIFDMGKNQTDQTSITLPGLEVEYVFFASNSPLTVMEQYTGITGKSPVIPGWSLEPWLSRRGPAGWVDTMYPRQELDQMEQNGQHIGVILWEGIRHQFLKDQEFSAYDLVNYWHDKGMKVVFWDRTGQIEDTPENLKKYKYDQKPVKKYFIRDGQGEPIKVGPKGEIANPDLNKRAFVYIDTSNPEAMEWYFKNKYALKVKSDNGKSGPNGYNLDGVKIDFSELLPKDLSDYKVYKPTPGIANVHAVSFSEQTMEWLQTVKPEGGITWTRGGGLGLQRGGVFWNGDRSRNLSQLKGTVSSLLSVSVSGLAYAGHDLGGYMRGNDAEVEETYIRGVQFATFSPFFHDHGSAQSPREQNRYGRENYAFYSRVRYNLLPYLEELIEDASVRGWPMMRPLFYYHPEDATSWTIDDEYYLGKEILVAPILSKGTSRVVYLPTGNWVDLWTNERYKGNSQILVNKALNRIPVFVRENAILPLALNENLEIGGDFLHKDKNDLRIIYKLLGLKNGVYSLPKNNEGLSSLKVTKDGRVLLKFENINEDFGVIIPNAIPTAIHLNNKELLAADANFGKQKQGWKYDPSSSELKIKIEAVKGLSEYEIELIGLPSDELAFVEGAEIAEVPQPNVPNIVSVEGWNESVDIVFDKDDALGERYIINYGSLNGGVRQSRVVLNYGNKVTIGGLKNGEKYIFRVWAETQLHKSLETDWFVAVPTGDKNTIFQYSGSGLFIDANHSSDKSIAEDGSKKYSFSIDSDRASTVKVWVQLNKYITHHDYNKWYETTTKTLNKTDVIEVDVPENHTLNRIFIAPEGETPFFNDEF